MDEISGFYPGTVKSLLFSDVTQRRLAVGYRNFGQNIGNIWKDQAAREELGERMDEKMGDGVKSDSFLANQLLCPLRWMLNVVPEMSVANHQRLPDKCSEFRKVIANMTWHLIFFMVSNVLQYGL